MLPILLMNPNGSEATTKAMCALTERHFERVVGWTNANGPPMITNSVALKDAADDVAKASLPVVAGIIIAAFGDPGREALAKRSDCPVVGIGASAAKAADQSGQPFAVATTTPDLEASIDALMHAEAKQSAYLGCFFTDGDPEILLKDQKRLDVALIDAALRAERAGAASVIIGGGPLAEAAKRIAPKVSARLIHPLDEACLALKRCFNDQRHRV